MTQHDWRIIRDDKRILSQYVLSEYLSRPLAGRQWPDNNSLYRKIFRLFFFGNDSDRPGKMHRDRLNRKIFFGMLAHLIPFNGLSNCPTGLTSLTIADTPAAISTPPIVTSATRNHKLRLASNVKNCSTLPSACNGLGIPGGNPDGGIGFLRSFVSAASA